VLALLEQAEQADLGKILGSGADQSCFARPAGSRPCPSKLRYQGAATMERPAADQLV